MLAEEMLKRRDVGAVRMAALLGLPELLGVAEQHQVLGRLRHRQHVRKGELPRLIDEEHVDGLVEFLPGP